MLTTIAEWVGYVTLAALLAWPLWLAARRVWRWYEMTTFAEFTMPQVAVIYLESLVSACRRMRGGDYVPRFAGIGVFRCWIGVMWLERREERRPRAPQPTYVVTDEDDR